MTLDEFTGFKGNKKLRTPNLDYPYTEEQIKEIVKCKNDILYFGDNYFYARTIDEGIKQTKLRDFQKDLISSFYNEKRVIVNASRQIGKTHSYSVFVLHRVLFFKDQVIIILANKQKTALKIFGDIMLAYERLPLWLQQGIIEKSKHEILLENNSRILTFATTSDSVRSYTANIIIIDEVAAIHPNLFEEFYVSTLPTISSGKTSKIFLVSTPNFKNHFYYLFKNAKEGKNGYVAKEYPWSVIPDRDEEWKQEQIREIGVDRFESEYNCKFLSGKKTNFLPIEILEDLEPKETILPNFDIGIDLDFMYIYENPVSEGQYVIGVDSSKMLKNEDSIEKGDKISIQVLKLGNIIKQVAHIYIHKDFDYFQLPNVISNLAKAYNNARVYIENNDIGQEIADDTAKIYDNVFYERPRLPGFRTTSKTRNSGILNLKSLLLNYKIEINDFLTINQLLHFQNNGKRLEGNKMHDDAVLALIHALFFLEDPLFDEIKGLIKEQKYIEQNHNFLPDLINLNKDELFLKSVQESNNNFMIQQYDPNDERINDLIDFTKELIKF